MRIRTIRFTSGVAATAATLALGAALTAPAATPTASTSPAAGQGQGAGYVPGSEDRAQNEKLRKQLSAAKARKKAARTTGLTAAAQSTVYYDASGSPRFANEVAQTAQIWNSRVNSVELVEDPSRATLYFTEGSGGGSYYQGNGRGSGRIYIEYSQAEEYNSLRIVSHETGHALGLPDRYEQPCEKLMSGGGAGPTCTNPYPDAAEASEVETIWQYGSWVTGRADRPAA